MYVDSSQQFEFNKYAEKLNDRLAMIGFISVLGLEVLTRQRLIAWFSNL